MVDCILAQLLIGVVISLTILLMGGAYWVYLTFKGSGKH